jgi:predicted acylesterase/phospholipase RssA
LLSDPQVSGGGVETQSDAGRQPRIAVALSGGGHRACLFGLGALLYLADADKTGSLASVASVSGGSLANGTVAQEVDLTRASPDRLREVAARVAGQITGRGTVFGTAWTFAYLALVVAVAVAAAVAPWLTGLPIWIEVALCVLGLLLATWLISLRGKACALAFDRTLFRPGGRSTRLGGIHGGLDHVFCATDLHAGEHVYFSRDFVCSYRFGHGVPGDVRLSAVVQASAAFPGGFPASWLPTRRHDFRGGAQPDAATVRRMALVDGGVYDNMADQWACGMEARVARGLPPGVEFRQADEVVVVNSSAGLDWSALRGLRLPALGELLTLLRDKSVLYDNGNSLRRQALVTRFELAERDDEGLRGALVHIPQSPFRVPRRLADEKGSDGAPTARAGRAATALDALRESGGTDVEAEWTAIAKANAAVPTTLVKFDVATSARLLHHAYVLAMVNLHVLLGYPLLDLPALAEFEALARGEAPPAPPRAPVGAPAY